MIHKPAVIGRASLSACCTPQQAKRADSRCSVCPSGWLDCHQEIVSGKAGRPERGLSQRVLTVRRCSTWRPEHFANGCHRETSFGHDSERKRCFFGPAAIERFFRISAQASSAQQRCSSRIGSEVPIVRSRNNLFLGTRRSQRTLVRQTAPRKQLIGRVPCRLAPG